MEVQLAVTSASRTDGHHIGCDTTTTTTNKSVVVVPNYLKPSTGSCHHACKYGGTHTFEAHHHQPPIARTPPDDRFQKRRSSSLLPRKLFGRRVGDKQGGAVAVDAAAAAIKVVKEKKTKKMAAGSGVDEWKDIVAYGDTAPPPSHGSSASSLPAEKQRQQSSAEADSKKPQAKPMQITSSSKASAAAEPTTTTHKSTHTTGGTKGVIRPPRGGKKISPAGLVVASRKKAVVVDRELVDGYQPLSPSLLQNRASLLRDLEEEMVVDFHEATTSNVNASELKMAYDNSLDHVHEDGHSAAAGGSETYSSRPVMIPAHRRAKSVTIGGRFALARQASKNSATTSFIKLRSKSSKGIPAAKPSQQEEIKKKPARLRSRRGSSSSSLGGAGELIGSSSAGLAVGRGGVQLRARSLRRRGGAGGGSSSSGGGGFVVPAVSLRHQKTLEKKRSQRLYNNVIEETASKLVKTRKSRVKALVGAFESVISKIAK